MATKKQVAAVDTNATTIPPYASSTGELEASGTVTASTQNGTTQDVVPTVDAAALQARKAGLERARAAKAAKALAKKQAVEAEIHDIQHRLAADAKADRRSFGEIREIARTIPTAEEYIQLHMPEVDLFDHTHPGVQLNRHKFEPGKTYQLRGDVALEVKRRLAMFEDEQKRLLRPNADRKALADVNRGSQWTSRGGNAITPLGRLEDIPTASDEVILTVDF